MGYIVMFIVFSSGTVPTSGGDAMAIILGNMSRISAAISIGSIHSVRFTQSTTDD